MDTLPQYLIYFQAILILVIFYNRECNGDRTWKTLPSANAKPQYDCAAFGQMHYRTFDGKLFKFQGGKCEYILMSDCRHDTSKPFCDIEVANINVRVRNTRCKDSYEAFMCKEVTIDLKLPDGKAEIIMMQEKVIAKLNDALVHTFTKGNYPQPLTPVDGMDGVQIFKVKTFDCSFFSFKRSLIRSDRNGVIKSENS